MPSLKRLWEENKDKGLHIIHVESQGHTEAEVRAFCKKNGVTFPNSTNRSSFSAYQGDNGLPYAFVIGVEGKVVFQGRGDYKSVIHAELAKIRYPGLGKLTVAKEVHKAATYFGAKNFAKAISEAEKALEKLDEASEAEAIADAQYVITRTHSVAERHQKRVEEAKAARDYDIALEELGFLAKAFKGLEAGDNASSERKTLSKDATVKKELKALGALAGLNKILEKERDPAKKRETLLAFAKKYDGLRAAERAREATE